MTKINIKNIIECLLISSEEPISINELLNFFKKELDSTLTRETLLQVIEEIKQDYTGRSLELCEVTTGLRFQIHPDYVLWLKKFSPEKQERYSQAVLEILALIVYRQPITRGEIEQVRGVPVKSQIIKILLEREWIRILGYKQVPGKPALYGTTSKFLNDFNLESLDQLPKLTEVGKTELLVQEEFNL